MIIRRLLSGVRCSSHLRFYRWADNPNHQWSSSKKKQAAKTQSRMISKERLKNIVDAPPVVDQPAPPVQQTKSAATSSINRELFNDMVQLPLKFIAYKLAGDNNGPFLAELKRSAIDALNHLVLYFVNKVSTKPSREYPYGITKLKNIVCNIPAVLFVISGIETIGESLASFVQHTKINDISNLGSMSLYALSIAVELFVVYRNIASANLMEHKEGDTRYQKCMRFFRNLSDLKNPLFQVILYENIVTLTSTLVPLLCEVVHWILPSLPYVFPVGTLTLGIIQIFVGVHLFKANIGELVGEKAVDESVSKTIVDVVKESEYVDSVAEVKAVKIGSQSFRSSMDVNIDKDYLVKKIQEDYEDYIHRIIYDPDPDKRKELLYAFIEEMPIQLLKDVSTEFDRLEQKTKERFEECTDSDLDFNIEAQSEEEVEKLEDSVEDSANNLKEEEKILIRKEIHNILAEGEKLTKTDPNRK